MMPLLERTEYGVLMSTYDEFVGSVCSEIVATGSEILVLSFLFFVKNSSC